MPQELLLYFFLNPCDIAVDTIKAIVKMPVIMGEASLVSKRIARPTQMSRK